MNTTMQAKLESITDVVASIIRHYRQELAIDGLCYRAGLLSGIESWSGSTLIGRARQYSGSYYHSRKQCLLNLQNRLADAIQHYPDITERVDVDTDLVLIDSRQRRMLCLYIDEFEVGYWTGESFILH